MTRIEETIRELRDRVKASGASYRRLARLGRLNDKTVANFLAGRGIPSTDTLAGIERGLSALEDAPDRAEQAAA